MNVWAEGPQQINLLLLQRSFPHEAPAIADRLFDSRQHVLPAIALLIEQPDSDAGFTGFHGHQLRAGIPVGFSGCGKFSGIDDRAAKLFPVLGHDGESLPDSFLNQILTKLAGQLDRAVRHFDTVKAKPARRLEKGRNNLLLDGCFQQGASRHYRDAVASGKLDFGQQQLGRIKRRRTEADLDAGYIAAGGFNQIRKRIAAQAFVNDHRLTAF